MILNWYCHKVRSIAAGEKEKKRGVRTVRTASRGNKAYRGFETVPNHRERLGMIREKHQLSNNCFPVLKPSVEQ